ncbi:MAG TPA: aldose epimerase family protein, partial [Streptosporangiaceae bacterium]|nr:aldose epimerase family protein [Streptosporangiaceae bacterium]
MRVIGKKYWTAISAALAALTIAGGSLAAPHAHAVPAHHSAGLSLTREFFGNAVEPFTGKKTAVFRYTLRNANGMSVRILTYGGIVQSIDVPGRNGAVRDVVLGFRTLGEYVAEASPPVTANGGPYFGELIGRYGNRIANGSFMLKQPDGQVHTYTLQQNNGVNSLHGGLVGFGNHIWQDRPVRTRNAVGVRLTLVSPDGDGSGAVGSPGCPAGCTGYPGTLKVVVTYTLDNAGALRIHYVATDESPNLNTVLNLTNHAYFNLAGEASGSAENQFISINASRYTPTDSGLIPTGQLAPVAGSPFDFTRLTRLGARINDCTGGPSSLGCQQLLFAHGLDHNWVLNSTGPRMGGLLLAAVALDPSSGRELKVWTDQPGVQFYASNFLNGTLVGISGHTYRQTQAYTFETQHFPDSPNHPLFPSTELGAGQTVASTTI